MLFFVTKLYYSETIWKFLASAGWGRLGYIRPLNYETLFYSRRAPRGHYIFTDFDRLSAYEVACAASLAAQLRAVDPRIRIYNDPVQVLERTALLNRLQQVGINDFGVTRVDTGARPPVYPAFIRCEDDCKAPDTGLINSDAEYDAALADLRRRGIPTKRRIAVQYHAERSADGYFRKYGAIRIGRHFMLQHILRNTDWYVKRGQVESDTDFQDEYLALAENFTHVPELERIFDVAGLDYGRADYAIIDGRIQVYEINTNPSIPKLGRRRESNVRRYASLGPQLLRAFKELDTPHGDGPPLRIKLAEPPFEPFQKPDLVARGQILRHWYNAVRSIMQPPAIGFEAPR